MLDEDKLNMQVRKFLKHVGVTSQREIERAVHELEEKGELPEGGSLRAVMTLRIESLGLEHEIDGELEY